MRDGIDRSLAYRKETELPRPTANGESTRLRKTKSRARVESAKVTT